MEKELQQFYKRRKWKPFPFQVDVLNAYLSGKSGLLNAPTGSGKTLAMALPILLKWKRDEQKNYKKSKKIPGPILIWLTPIRALAAEIKSAIQLAADELELGWDIQERTGDTSHKDRAKQKTKPPQVLITTPESLHILLTQKDYISYFENLECIVADEWHELLGNKRGVQVELALSRLHGFLPNLCVWGISATIGNLEEALEVIAPSKKNRILIKANIDKKIQVETILPDDIETLPWAGHLGVRLLDKAIPIMERSTSTLVFTNTRSQAEIWYQYILAARPDWAGIIALHHGSLDGATRRWVEQALHASLLKVVVCTSSLDLGVDFRPVETVIQIGSPKGVARFAQRAGRSGHRPGAISKIYMLPTHALELLEAAGFKQAIANQKFESRVPVLRAFDTLVQYLVTLSCGVGFKPEEIYEEIKQTYCFQSIDISEWNTVLNFIRFGGDSLRAYEEFSKVAPNEEGIWKIHDNRMALKHKFNIGTITSETHINIQYMSGRRVGTIEEYFISRLNEGDVFTFAGKNLELIQLRHMQALVKPTTKKSKLVPSWAGGRMPLSNEISIYLRSKLADYLAGDRTDPEMVMLEPLFQLQQERSHIPDEDELLIECITSDEGLHIYVYPFEGRMVNEGIAMLMAYRISRQMPITFSVAMNDYGFELLTDQIFDAEKYITYNLLSEENLSDDLYTSTNYSEMARRKFRDIARIAGLIFTGYPGQAVKTRHVQASSNLFYEVFRDYDGNNLLLRQALEEVMLYQLEETRLRAALKRIASQKIVIMHGAKPTPFCFPIMADRLREKLTNEKLEDRLRRIIKQAQASDK
jgi:ATP-dependent Lhr-like helicase